MFTFCLLCVHDSLGTRGQLSEVGAPHRVPTVWLSLGLVPVFQLLGPPASLMHLPFEPASLSEEGLCLLTLDLVLKTNPGCS